MEKNKKKQIAKISVFIASLFVIFMSVTYAFINITLIGEKKQVITAGNLDLELQEENNNITLTNAMPMYDEVGMIQEPFTFKLINKTANDTNYILKLVKVPTANELDPNIVKYGLTKDGIGQPKLLSTISNEVVDSGVIKGNQTIDYTLRLWIDSGVTDNNAINGKSLTYKIEVEVSQMIEYPVLTANDLIEKANAETLDYNTASPEEKGEMWTFTHPETKPAGATTDYRYIGADPNNRIVFNGEENTWKIVGVFPVDDGTGKIENRIKIIRDIPIGKYSWDNKPSGTGSSTSSYGSNEWSDARLKEVLNSGAYWNRTTGSCPTGSNGAMSDCDFTTNGLTEEAQNQIGDAVYYLGAVRNYSTADNGLPSHFYGYERGEDKYDATRTTEWTGKVALMYPSDYGFATSGGTTMNRETCLAKEMYNWDGAADCINNDWLLKNNEYATAQYQWTLAPSAGRSDDAFYVNSTGYVNNFSVMYTTVVRPVAYLRSDIKIEGLGTREEPYKIK